MTETDPGRLRYYVTSEYAPAALLPNEVDRISFGRYSTDGGCYWEGGVEFRMLGGRLSAQLGVFQDAWRGFNETPEALVLLARLGEHDPDEPVTVAGICEAFDSAGFKHADPRTNEAATWNVRLTLDVAVGPGADVERLAERLGEFLSSDPDDLFPEIATVDDWQAGDR